MATPVFSIGDRVWVRLRTPTTLGLKKVAPRWGGPFVVVDIVSPGDTFRIRPVDQPLHSLLLVHGSRMKRYYHREAGLGLGAPYTLTADGEVESEESLELPGSMEDEEGVEEGGTDLALDMGSVPLDSLQAMSRQWTLHDIGDGSPDE